MIGLKDVCVFFKTRVENAGTLSQIGDLGLTPLRYLMGGKTIQLLMEGGVLNIHSVASFHKEGKYHSSISTYTLRSSPTHMIKTIGAVLFVVPGLFLAVVKLVDYAASAGARINHRLVREHLTPVNREIGTWERPIRSDEQLRAVLAGEWNNDARHRPTNALIIHADGNLEINTEPGILRFNPMRLILEGAQIVHRSSATSRLDDRMHATGKWNTGDGWRSATNANPHASVVAQRQILTVAQALEAPLRKRGWLTCKCFHEVFQLPRPAAGV
jgi:hypothetical protein